MADSTVQTNRTLPRNEIAQAFRGNPRLIKALEDLLMDVAVNLPSDITDQSDEAATLSYALTAAARAPAPGATSSPTLDALTLASIARGRPADQATAAIDELRALVAAARSFASTLSQLRRDLDDVRALIQGI